MVCRTKRYQRLSGLIVAACLAGTVGATVHPSRSSANPLGVRLAADVATPTLMPAAGQYVPLSPQRIATIATLASGGTYTFSPSATTGVPATGVSALVFSLTATNTTKTSGFLKSYAAGAVEPAATSLSYGSAAAFTSTAIVSKVGANNGVTLANSGATVRVVVDLLGYYTSSAATTPGSTFIALPSAQRIMNEQAVAAGGTISVAPLGKAGVPASDVSAVVANVSVRSLGAGVLKVYPSDWTSQTAEGNFRADNWEYLNRIPVKLGADGQFKIATSAAASALVDVDIVGYYQTPGATATAVGSTFVPLAPTRLVANKALAAGTTWSETVTGSYGVPTTGVNAVGMHVSAGNASGNGSMSTYPAGATRPAQPELYDRTTEPSDVQQTPAVDASGQVTVAANSASATLSVDVFGYFQAATAPAAPVGVTASGQPATVSWSAPASDGGAPITGYTVRVDGTVNGRPYSSSIKTSYTTATLPVLPRGRSFSVTVVAQNAIGDSAAAVTSLALPFQHPGVLLNREQLDFVKARVAAGAEPWKGSYTFISGRSEAQMTYAAHPVATLTRANSSATDIASDNIAAYTDALLYYLSGDANYADKAISILNGWGRTLTGVAADAQLDAVWASEMMPRAAEIIRYSYTPAAGKTALDVPALSNMFRNVLLPQLSADSAGYRWSNGNWATSMADGTIDIGVFSDDAAVFDTGLSMWRERVPAYLYQATDGAGPVAPAGGVYDTPAKITCFWYNQQLDSKKAPTYCTVPAGANIVDNQTQETCRDMTHVVLGTEAMMYAAETARSQSVDLYGEQAGRVIRAMEFTAQHDLEALNNPTSGSTPSSGTGSGKVSGGLCSTGTFNYGGVAWEAGFVTAYNEFHSRLGYAMPYTEQMMAKIANITGKPTAGLVRTLHMAWPGLTNLGTP